MSLYFVKRGSKVGGPFSLEKIESAIQAKKILLDDLFSSDREGPWHNYAEIKNLSVNKSNLDEEDDFLEIPTPKNPTPKNRLKNKKVNQTDVLVGKYVQESLGPNEKVRYLGKMHWRVFVFPLMCLPFELFMSFASTYNSPSRVLSFLIVTSLLVLPTLLLLLIIFVAYRTSEYAVTSRKVVVKQGFIKREAFELQLNKIDAMAIEQGLIDRLLNSGAIGVSVATEKVHIYRLANPMEFKRAVEKELHS